MKDQCNLTDVNPHGGNNSRTKFHSKTSDLEITAFVENYKNKERNALKILNKTLAI